MKNYRPISLALLLLSGAVESFAQKTLAEGSVVYDMVIQTGNTTPQKGDALEGASTTVYMKGNNSRTDMVSALGNETTIHNAKSGNAVILKEFSGQKLMIKLTKENWESKNKALTGTGFELTSESKTILGYPCKKAIAKMADGRTFSVYYSPDIIVANKEYDPTFINLPGLAMEYEIESGRMKFKYTVSKINFDPVLVSKFDFPTSGYRVMTYEENQQMKKGN
jgi:GLPGLI family protein